MWQRFTERARRVVFFAQEEAGRAGHNVVSNEHLLLGLLREEDCVACAVLTGMGVNLSELRINVERGLTPGDGDFRGDMHFSDPAKRAIDFSYDEARRRSNNYIGTEHLLLGLIRAEDSPASRALVAVGADLAAARAAVAAHQAEHAPSAGGAALAAQPSSADAALAAAEAGIATTIKEAAYAGKPPSPRQPAAPEPGIGDLGTLRGMLGRDNVDVATDRAALSTLIAAYRARDDDRYRGLLHEGNIRILPAGTSIKLLETGDVRPGRGRQRYEIPYLIRILDGEAAGRKGWIMADTFTHVGPDESPFPPED